jgi:GTP-binding protein LepA
MADPTLIRNFCIIAHIDHGKSTLADRILQLTHAVSDREFHDRILDDMDLEQERGITIKLRAVSMHYTAKDGKTYLFNLIDTPGHVDFGYEVSRSMAACDGALLVVDASQGVEAQTVANTYLAQDRNLSIIPIINKVDLPNADVPEVVRQVEDILAIPMDEGIHVSAKTGMGVEAILEAIVQRIPPPKTTPGAVPRALVFDSVYDAFRGVLAYVRIVDGSLKAGDRIRMLSSGTETQLKEVGTFTPTKLAACPVLNAGEVGYLVGTIREPSEVRVGDTVTLANAIEVEPLPGFRRVRPMVFSGFYPADSSEYDKFRQNLEKLSLNDSSFTFHPETSVALGFGFRCGFLGLLHMEIVQERLRREFDVEIISTTPAVVYRVALRGAEETVEVDNPVHLPDPTRIERIEEPLIRAVIICHNEHIGDIMKLVRDRRGDVTKTDSIDRQRVMLTCSMPLNEILTDFHDGLKSVSRGYASMDYEHSGYVASDIVKMDILLNSEPVDAFSCLVHRTRAESKGRQICKALKDSIPPHQFTIPIQAAIGRTIVARETIRQFRKDVTAKLYGGDVTRKMKLLERQKAGKRRMRQFGKVDVPQKAFVSVLKSGV